MCVPYKHGWISWINHWYVISEHNKQSQKIFTQHTNTRHHLSSPQAHITKSLAIYFKFYFFYFVDPSYRGQILIFSFPLIGNYGVPPNTLDENGISRFFESSQIHLSGISFFLDVNFNFNYFIFVIQKESLFQNIVRLQVTGTPLKRFLNGCKNSTFPQFTI